MRLSNTERCWYVNICDQGAFLKYRTSEESAVILKSSEITNVYIHSRIWYDLYHMLFVRNVVDNLDRLNFAYYKSFPTVSSSLITKKLWRQSAEQAVQTWKLSMLVLTLKGYLSVWYSLRKAGADIVVESWVSEFWPCPRFSRWPYPEFQITVQ